MLLRIKVNIIYPYIIFKQDTNKFSIFTLLIGHQVHCILDYFVREAY